MDYNDNISAEVRAWAVEHGDDMNLRIALCGYEGEHDMPPSWECVRGRSTNGGYGNLRKNGKNENGSRERIWFSPGCLEEKTLFRFEATAEDRLEGC